MSTITTRDSTPYTIKVKVQSALKLMPHSHPGHRFFTAIFYPGRGDEFDTEKLQVYPPGTVMVLSRQHRLIEGNHRILWKLANERGWVHPQEFWSITVLIGVIKTKILGYYPQDSRADLTVLGNGGGT